MPYFVTAYNSKHRRTETRQEYRTLEYNFKHYKHETWDISEKKG